MKFTQITRGGQISVPAQVRRRWRTRRVRIEDHGDSLTIFPAQEDPLEEVIGCLADAELDLTQLERDTQREEAELERVEQEQWQQFNTGLN